MFEIIKNIIGETKATSIAIEDDSLSVEEVVNMPTFAGAKVIAGHIGLQNRCRHITILETPEGVSWLRGEEILLTAGYAFTAQQGYRDSLMIDAKERGVSAVAIKLNRYFGDIQPDLIRQADQFQIPLITLPSDLIYTDTISEFYQRLFFKKHEYILNLNNIYEKLLSLSLENKEILEILNTISDLTESQTLLLNASADLIYGNLDELSHEVRDSYLHMPEDLLSYFQNNMKPVINDFMSDQYVSCFPILNENQVEAFLFVVKESPLDRLDISSIDFGLPVLASKLEMKKGNEMARNRINRSLVEIMLNKKDLPDSFYENIERDLGWNFPGILAGVTISLHERIDQNADEHLETIFDYLENLFRDVMLLCIKGSNGIYVFNKYNSDVELEDFVASIYAYLKEYREIFDVSIGVSTMYPSLRDIENMRNESYLASLFTKRGIIYYNSLDTIRLLYPLKNDQEIQTYYGNTIKKLEVYDHENNAGLVNTLETFFRYNLNRKIVSKKLYIHVETLRYRLNRIEEITGYSLNDSEGLFALQMGVKLKSLIKL